MRRYLWAVSVALGVLVIAKGVVPVLNTPGFSSATVLQGLFRTQNSSTLQWSLKCSSESSTVADAGCDKAMPSTTGEWVSDGQKAGASIEVQFPIEVELKGVHIFDRGDARETIQDGHIEFFDGTRYPAVGGIAVLASPTFPNAVLTFPASVKTVGFRFVVDSVSSSTTAVGLAEIAPVFETVKDARIRPRRLVGKVGTSTNDIDGALPLIPINTSSQSSPSDNPTKAIVAVEDKGIFSIAAAEKRPCYWGGQVRSDGTAVLPNGDTRFLCRDGIWWVNGGSVSGFGGVMTADPALCPPGEFCFTSVPVCTVSEPWYLSASNKLWQEFKRASSDTSCPNVVSSPSLAPASSAVLRFDLSNDFYQGAVNPYPYANFHVTEAQIYIEDSSAKRRLSLGTARDSTDTNQGPAGDGWTPVSMDVGAVVNQQGTYHVYWQWKSGWDTSHVKNLRIEYNGQSYGDRDRGVELKDAFDGLGDAADGGQYLDHYVEVGSPTILPPPPAPPAHLQITVPSTRPTTQQFTSGMKNTVWAQYKLTAIDGDVTVRSIPVAVAMNHQAIPKSAGAVWAVAVGTIRLYASSDSSMVNKIQIGAPQGVPLGVGGVALITFDKYPFALKKDQSMYVTIETDIAKNIVIPSTASMGFGDSQGGATAWATLGGDPIVGWYDIEALATQTKKPIDQKTITSTGAVGGTIAAGPDHQLVSASLQVRESSTPALPSFTGGIIDEPVFQFSLVSQAGAIGIKRIEFVGSGTCNGDLQERGNAKLIDVTKTPEKLIAQWTNQLLNDLVYSTFDHEPIAVALNNPRTLQLRVTTNCANGQTLQYAIGGTHAFSGARATVSGIQWFIPSLGASQAIDSPATRGVPLSSALLSARSSDPLDEDTLTEVSIANTLLCLQTEEDRSSYPFEVTRVALIPQNPPRVGEASTLNIRLKNRFDIAQLYSITVDWGDGATDVYNAPRALKGRALREITLEHTYTQTAPAGFPIQVRVHNNDRVTSSALLSCTVVPSGGDTSDPPPPPPPPTDDPNPNVITIMPGQHTSVGVIFETVQEIGSMTLSMIGANLSKNTIKIWSAGSDQQYTTVPSGMVLSTIAGNSLSIKFKNPLSARYLKIQMIVDTANTAGVAIKNPTNAIEVYSPYGP